MFRWLAKLFERHPSKAGWRRFSWSNWARNRHCIADCYFEPQSREEIALIVKKARREGRRIRVVGNSFSWSELIPTDQYLVCLKRMDRVVDLDTFEKTITIETGMAMGTLTSWVNRAGMAIHSPPVIPFLSVGGVIAVGAHGSSTVRGPFPDQILTFYYVSAEGALEEVTREDHEHANGMGASLGALGIVYQVKIQCTDDFRVDIDNHLANLDESIERIPELVDKYHYVDVFTFPTTGKAWLMLGNETTKPIDITLWERIKLRVGAVLIQDFLGNLGLWLLTHTSTTLTPRLLNLQLKFNPSVSLKAVVSSFRALHYETYYPKCMDFSYAVDAKDARALWRLYLRKLDEYEKQGKYPVNMVIHSRFIRRSSAYLSPAVDREMTAYVEMVSYRDTPHLQEFFEEVERELLVEFPNARPHWGKLFYGVEDYGERYAGSLESFEHVRREMDPGGVFLNEFLWRSVLGNRGDLPPLERRSDV